MVKEYTEVVQEVVQEVVNETKMIVNSNKLRDKMSKAFKNGEIASHANNKRKL